MTEQAQGAGPRVRVAYKPVVRGAAKTDERSKGASGASATPDPFRRPANEDDDGYDPYSDRPADPAPLFERDPWS